MSEYATNIQLARGCIVAGLPREVDGMALQYFCDALASRVHETRVRRVVFDASGVAMLDAADFMLLRRTMGIAEALGARCVLCGIQPGVAAALVTLDADVDEIECYLGLDDALDALWHDADLGPGGSPELEEVDSLTEQGMDDGPSNFIAHSD